MLSNTDSLKSGSRTSPLFNPKSKRRSPSKATASVEMPLLSRFSESSKACMRDFSKREIFPFAFCSL